MHYTFELFTKVSLRDALFSIIKASISFSIVTGLKVNKTAECLGVEEFLNRYAELLINHSDNFSVCLGISIFLGLFIKQGSYILARQHENLPYPPFSRPRVQPRSRSAEWTEIDSSRPPSWFWSAPETPPETWVSWGYYKIVDVCRWFWGV